MSGSDAQPPRLPFPMGLMPSMPLQMPLPQIVFNGFLTSHTASEVTTAVSFSDRPIVMLIMSPSVAKSFAMSILSAVDHYEKSAGLTVDTIEDIQNRMVAYNEADPQK
jgi:hypothetical protein